MKRFIENLLKKLRRALSLEPIEKAMIITTALICIGILMHSALR